MLELATNGLDARNDSLTGRHGTEALRGLATFHLRDRPWLVRGIVASAPRRTTKENPYVILRGNDTSGLPRVEERVNVVAPSTSEAAATIVALHENDYIAVLSSNASIRSRNHNPWIEITEPAHIEVITTQR